MADPVAVWLAEIRTREHRATPPPWDVDDHSHLQHGCRCGSCEDCVGWVIDHPEVLCCGDRIAKRSVTDGEKNGFGRDLESCDSLIPLLSWEDADFAAHARTDVPALLAALEAVRHHPQPVYQLALIPHTGRTVCGHDPDTLDEDGRHDFDDDGRLICLARPLPAICQDCPPDEDGDPIQWDACPVNAAIASALGGS